MFFLFVPGGYTTGGGRDTTYSYSEASGGGGATAAPAPPAPSPLDEYYQQVLMPIIAKFLILINLIYISHFSLFKPNAMPIILKPIFFNLSNNVNVKVCMFD